MMSNQQKLALSTASIGLLVLLWFIVYEPAGTLASSIAILVLFATVFFKFGLISVPSIVISAAFVPSLAYFWAYLHGAKYISIRTPWIQDIPVFGETAMHLSVVSLLFTIAVLLVFQKKTLADFRLAEHHCCLSKGLYVFLSMASLFFFWLAEPSFSTIISSTYTEIISDRFENTQYAGGVGMLCWLFALSTFAYRYKLKVNAMGDKWADKLFLVLTVAIILWLVLHSRRSELMGIGISLMLAIIYLKGKFWSSLSVSIFLFILIFIGIVRGTSLVGYLDNSNYSATSNSISNEQKINPSKYLAHRDLVESLPGGASSIFMTYLNTIHHFRYTKQDFYHGSTFSNYIYAILPTNIYKSFEIETPDYFFEKVLKQNLYRYNGGTYIGAVFYGNFGVFGAVLFGLFIGLYIIFAINALQSTHIVMQVTGFYLTSMVFRGFWYELITIAKPLLIVLLPAFLMLVLIQKYASVTFKQRFSCLFYWPDSKSKDSN